MCQNDVESLSYALRVLVKGDLIFRVYRGGVKYLILATRYLTNKRCVISVVSLQSPVLAFTRSPQPWPGSR